MKKVAPSWRCVSALSRTAVGSAVAVSTADGSLGFKD